MIIKKFEEQVKKKQDKIAVKAGENVITYGFLDECGNRLAHALLNSKLFPGIEKPAALLFGHGESMIIGIIGALKSGRVYIPFDPMYPENRLIYMLNDSNAGLIVTDNINFVLAERLKSKVKAPIGIINLDDILKREPVHNPGIYPDSNQMAYILYTSGSTGKPKGVVQVSENIFYYVRNWVERFSVSDRDRMALFASYCHDGAIPDIYSALLYGAVLYPFDVKRRANIEAPAQWLIKEGITIWHSVPTWYRYFVNTITGMETFQNLRMVILGGEQVREHDIIMFKKRFPHSKFGNIYGQTESTVSSIWTLSPADDFHKVLIGEPIDQTAIYVVDNEGNETDEYEVGEILVTGRRLSPGYLNNAEATHQVFTEDEGMGRIYWSGDLGRLQPDGSIEILGRKDYQVKVRGFRIEPGEIETALMNHPDIGEAVVMAKKSDEGSMYNTVSGDFYLCAYFVAKKEFTVSELRTYLAGKLPDYMIPAYFTKLDTMPLTPNGKLDRKSLDAYGTRLGAGAEYAPPGNETEKILIQLWKETLKIDNIGIDDNFFDLGGNSMDVITLNNELKQTFKCDIPVASIFRYLTVRSFAQYLTQSDTLDGAFEKSMDRGEEIEKSRIRVEEKKNRMGKNRDENSKSGLEIAVIGMIGRFPGAKNIDEFWNNLTNGVESITFFTDEELEAAGVSPELLKNPNYVKAQPVLADIECFDASFFGYTPREARIMDPQVRIFHECVWHALEDAGYNPDSYEKLIGCYAGASVNYSWIASNLLSENRDVVGVFESRQFFDKEFMCTQLAYNLNLRGPAVLVQTSCSTSLVAIHMACQGLIGGECDMALAGGVSIPFLRKEGYLCRKGITSSNDGHARDGMIFSSDGHCRVFDAKADGTVFGSGVGVVLLKRLEDAIEDRDNIYAVVKGSFINNDGRNRAGFTAPGVEGEAAVIRNALQIANFNSETVGYVETHSTGTSLGGPIEIEGLQLAFNTNKKGFCALGCAKTNIGHLNIASGMAGFIKTALVLKHGLIPPNLYFETPDPAIDFENSPFYVNTKLSQWKSNQHPRRAGVSSFGIGGTNAHVLLEESSDSMASTTSSREYRLILLSARTEQSLERMTQNLTEYLKENRNVDFADVSYTLMVGRKAFEYRRILVCPDSNEAIEKFSSSDSGKVQSFFTKGVSRPVIFMFSGLGSQYAGMGKDLYRTEPVFREAANTCIEILKRLSGYDITDVLYPDIPVPQPHDWNFEIAQAVVFVLEYALARLLMSLGITPYAMIGYSFGEYTAACISGVLSLEDALTMVVSRGKLIEKVQPGLMLSVPLTRNELAPFLDLHPGLSMAIDNGPSCIIAGTEADVEAFEIEMKKNRYICMRLQGTRAIHSKMMAPILKEFEEVIAGKITLNKPQIPYISDVSGGWITSEDIMNPGYWSKHLSCAVEFSEGIKELMKVENAVFLEIGPGRDLSSLMVRHIENKPGFKTINLVRPPEQKISDVYVLYNRIGRLWLWGVGIDWNRFYSGEKRRRVSLPKYPFEPTVFPVLRDVTLPTDINNAPLEEKEEIRNRRPDLDTEYVSPRNEIEEKIARVWAQFFGIEKVGIDDNFFELGGDSLKVLIVLARINKAMDIELEMDEFFKGATIRLIAPIVSDKIDRTREKRLLSNLLEGAREKSDPEGIKTDVIKLFNQPVVLLNKPSPNILFCFPPIDAHAFAYRTISHLFPDYSLYSFGFIEEEGRLEKYVEIIKRIQPIGPYRLFTYSGGGRLTFDVAAALERSGCEVSDIILLDSFFTGETKLEDWKDLEFADSSEYLQGLGVEFLGEYIQKKTKEYWKYIRDTFNLEIIHADLHLILSEEYKDSPLAKSWGNFSTKPTRIYQGFGSHIKMLEPDFAEKNIKIIHDILKHVEGKTSL